MEVFIDPLPHFFVVPAMEKLDLQTRITLVRLFYENHSCAAAALRKFKSLHNLIKDPFSVTTVQRLLKKFESEGVVIDLPKSGRPSICDDVVEKVQKTLDEGQASSSMKIFSANAVSRETGIPRTTVQRALKQRLAMHPYHVHLLHEMKETDFPARVEFAEWFLEKMDEENFQERVLWTDEAHFHLDGTLSNHNCIIWAKENPGIFTTKSLHPQRVTVWCGFTSNFILPPAFLEQGQTVNAERYLAILRDHMLPNLPRRNKNIVFMQDGAPPHIANPVKDFLRNQFGDDIISRHFPHAWPPRSPDLNPCDYFLWGCLKHRVFLRQPRTLTELRTAIEIEIGTITRETLAKVVDNLFDRLMSVLATNGKHIE